MISLNKIKDKGYKPAFAASAEHAKRAARSIDENESDIDVRVIGQKEIGDKKIAGNAGNRETAVSDTAGSLRIETAKGRRSSQYAPESVTDRGRYGYMHYIHGFIGCVLVLLALIHIPFPEPFAWLPYGVAAVLALITLKTELSMAVSRILAIATAGMMFFLFALFFLVVPTLKADWYMTQYGWAAVCLILSAFMMIPILSEYSCRLKADCMEARAARRTAFFSVPSNIRPESR